MVAPFAAVVIEAGSRHDRQDARTFAASITVLPVTDSCRQPPALPPSRPEWRALTPMEHCLMYRDPPPGASRP